jgi:hypothetical protein
MAQAPDRPPGERVVYKVQKGQVTLYPNPNLKFVVGPAWKQDGAGNTVLVKVTKPLEVGFGPTPTAYVRLRGNVSLAGNPEPNWCEPVCECYCDCSTECVCDCDNGGSYCSCTCSCYCVCDCACECYCDCWE